MAHKHPIYDTDPHFKIDGDTRAIINMSDVKVALMQGDHNSERFTFEIPRYVDGHDMSLCNICQIHYLNVGSSTRATNAGIYEVEDLQFDPKDEQNRVVLSWLISSNVTMYVGSLSFVIRFGCSTDGVVDYIWNTAVCSGIMISSSICNSETVVQDYADILEQWRDKLEDSITALKGDLANSKKDIAELNDKKITKFYASNLGETNLTDSDKGKIQDMMLYGKSLQDGTPTPESPVEIQSVVNPVVKLYGNNLLNSTLQTTIHDGVTCTNNGDGTYTFNGTATNTTFFLVGEINANNLRYKMLGCPSGGNYYNNYAIFFDKDDNSNNKIIDIGDGVTFEANGTQKIYIVIRRSQINNLVFKPMITYDLSATYDDFEPYKEQTATLPYTLNAIPVSSGGNVTIGGQQYVSDYVDVERGKLVKMVDSSKLDNTQSIVDKTEWLLAVPQEIDLIQKEAQVFKALATYYPTTNISVNSEQLDGYTVFNYPLSMANGWNLIKEQLGDTREYIYDMELQSAEAYVNSEYAVTLTELGV